MIDYKTNPDPKRQLAEILAGKNAKPAPAPRPTAFPIVLTLPLPPAEVWPNARPHRWAKIKATKTQRTDAKLAAMNVPPLGILACSIQPTFFFSTNRRRDKDNAGAALKASIDGLVSHGLLADDHGVTLLPAVLLVDRERPRLELEIRLKGNP